MTQRFVIIMCWTNQMLKKYYLYLHYIHCYNYYQAENYFHVRTFIPHDYDNRFIKGYARGTNPPKYLITELNTEVLDNLFKEKIKSDEKNFKEKNNNHKYLKYKHKYLQLKNTR